MSFPLLLSRARFRFAKALFGSRAVQGVKRGDYNFWWISAVKNDNHFWFSHSAMPFPITAFSAKITAPG
jgi:hypothetical protein